jgi:hypothetical protein
MPGYAWPPALRTGSFDAMLNFEIADGPVYERFAGRADAPPTTGLDSGCRRERRLRRARRRDLGS